MNVSLHEWELSISDSLARLDLYGLCRGQFPVSMWLAAQSTRMQFARFLNRGATGVTGNGNELFRGEFFAFHWKIMQQLAT
jgi:hypothetical protein